MKHGAACRSFLMNKKFCSHSSVRDEIIRKRSNFSPPVARMSPEASTPL